MLTRLLIANRGEIAVRVIRACRERGIEAVAVCSTADRGALHTRLADRVVEIGPPPATESYLHAGRVIDAARQVGAEAIHPGYGFLSERADFAAACHDAGLLFVGPPPDVMARMGSKIAARRLMSAAGVPVVPGAEPEDQDDAGVRAAVRRVGLPALIKASAGGGGRGMRLVRTIGEVDEAIAAARREAVAAFGDGTLYVERLIERPRHVEVQIMADDHGHVVHLYERECSVQRRHQKVIEETPSPALSPALRVRMTEAAVAAARAVTYRNAGTVELLVEGAGDAARFYFLEMNTRLQVEHPITEAVTGVDLVGAQLAVTAGDPLPWTQAEIAPRGHACECRVYAEDPAQEFTPQAGRLLLYREPAGPGIRVDAGVTEGDEVSAYYDPLLAKLVVWAEDRTRAIDRARAALSQYAVLGVRTNVGVLGRVLAHPRFRAGDVDVELLERERETLLQAPPDAVRRVATAVAAVAGTTSPSAGGDPRGSTPPRMDPWDASNGWRGSLADDAAPDIPVELLGDHAFRVRVPRDSSPERSTLAWAVRDGYATWVFVDGDVIKVERQAASDRNAKRATATSDKLTAPMPATVVRLLVAPGDRVVKGTPLATLEAMKMELPLRAPRDGLVGAVLCREGDLVQPDRPLFELVS